MVLLDVRGLLGRVLQLHGHLLQFLVKLEKKYLCVNNSARHENMVRHATSELKSVCRCAPWVILKHGLLDSTTAPTLYLSQSVISL